MSSILPLAIGPSDVHLSAPRAVVPGDLSRIGRRLTEIATELTTGRRGPGLATCRRASRRLARPLTLLLDAKGGDIVACNLQFGSGAWWALSELVEEVGRIARAALDPGAARERGWTVSRQDGESLACFATTFDDPQGGTSLVLVTVIDEQAEAEQSEPSSPTKLLVDTRLPMWAIDQRTLRLVEVNEAAVGAYGYPRDALLGMRLTDMVADPAEVPGLVTSFAEWTGCEDLRWEGNHRCADGELAQVELLMRASDNCGAPIAFVLGRVTAGISGTWTSMHIA